MQSNSRGNDVAVIRESEIRSNFRVLEIRWQSAETFAVLPSNLPLSDEWLDDALHCLPQTFCTKHFLLLTSGSTGQPKMIVASRERAEHLVEVIHRAQDGEAARETICCLPLSYSYSFVNQWLWSRILGRRIILTDGFMRPDELKLALDAANDAMICMVGAQVSLLQSFFGGRTFPGIIRLHFAGGRFPQEQLGPLKQMFPNAAVFNNYGCAEAMPRLTIRRAEDSDVSANIGRPLAGVELKSGIEDQLLFRSPFRAVGFIENSSFHTFDDNDWVDTGDLGRADDNGMWILLGRKSEVFKRFGEKISLPAIDAVVKRAWIGELAFYRETDSMGENGHVMVIAPHPEVRQVKAILMELRRDFSRPHWPLRVESLERLPRLPNNKVDTRGLKEQKNLIVHWSQRY
jgi:long-chain acyl-CoA synthetase